MHIDRLLIFGVTRVFDEHAAFAGVQAGMARGARRQDAVHHVNAERDVVGDLFGAAHAHEIARTVLWQQSGDFGSHFARGFVRFTDGQAADGVAGKIELEKLASAFTAKVGESRALHDAELPLLRTLAVAASGFLKMFARAAGPGGCTFHGGFGLLAWRGSFNAFVEDHGDVRTERKLNLCGFFRREQVLGAVEVRTKTHAFVGDAAKLGEAENLIAAGVGEDGVRPGHELMQATEAANQFVAGTQIKMIGVGEEDFRAQLFERFLRECFDGSLRADGKKKWRFHCAVGRGEAAAPRSSGIGL